MSNPNDVECDDVRFCSSFLPPSSVRCALPARASSAQVIVLNEVAELERQLFTGGAIAANADLGRASYGAVPTTPGAAARNAAAAAGAAPPLAVVSVKIDRPPAEPPKFWRVPAKEEAIVVLLDSAPGASAPTGEMLLPGDALEVRAEKEHDERTMH